MAHYLLRFEGLFLGSSSALNCVAALRAGAELRRSSSDRLTVVTVLCDGGARYLSRFWNRDFVEKRGLSLAAGGFGGARGFGGAARGARGISCKFIVMYMPRAAAASRRVRAAPACALIGIPSRRGRRLRRARAPRPA